MKGFNISKKCNIIKTMVKQSEMIQVILIILAVIVAILADYILAKWECATINASFTESADRCAFVFLLVFINPFLLVVVYYFIWTVKTLLIGMFSEITIGVKKLKAIYRYCFIPLTKEEVKQLEFHSSDEYINYILDSLRYSKNQYVHINKEDLKKILSVCIEIYPENDIFELSSATISVIENIYDFPFAYIADFIRHYLANKDLVVSKSAVVLDSGIVRLHFVINEEETYTYEM